MISREIKESFERDRSIINKFYRHLPIAQKDEHDEIIAWASDHLRMLTSQLDDLKKFVKIKYFELLPKDQDGSVRIHAFLESYLEKHHFKLRPTDLKKNINLFQKNTSFKISELWFVPAGLRLILFHRFAQIIERVFVGQVKKSEVTEFKNVILSFLIYEKIDWRVFFEETSLVEKLLRRDPAKTYSLMDFATRDNYRHAVEHLALQSRKSEVEVTREILTAAANSHQNKGEQHVGYFLLGKNRKDIEREIGYKYTWRERISGISARIPGLFYFTLLFSLTIGGMLSVSHLLADSGFSGGVIFLYSFLFFIPTLIVAEDLINYLFTKRTMPKALSKMNFEKEIPLWARTMLVVPTQLGTGSDEPEKLLLQLENNYLNNQTKNLYFALLLAFRDSQEKNDVVTTEEKINLQKVRDGINRLNQKYSPDHPVFFVFFRPRIWNEKENLSIEWERKRGKIIEFNRLLRGGTTTFDLTNLDSDFLSSIKYIITIDQNDLLPKGAAQRLAATISHPLNQAKIDAKKGITSFGYGLIQPQLSCIKMKLPSLLETTFFEGIGWDSYSGVVSNIYQDVFGFGLFMGKGIYDIDVLNQVLDHRFPENTILSHDHLEGFYNRAGYASDIQIFEENPISYSSYTTRLMRWTRGDWQILPHVLGNVKNEAGKKVKNPLSFLARFKLLENALRSFFLPSVFLALLTALFFDNSFFVPIVYFSLGFLIFQPSLALVEFLITQRVTLVWREYCISLAIQCKSFFLQIVFRVLFLSHLSFLTIIAISKTLFRMLISKKHLLEWQIFHHANYSPNKNKFRDIFRDYYLFESLCISVFALKIFFGDFSLFSGLFIILATATPIWAEVFSQGYSIKKGEEMDASWFNRLAVKTWRYFDETVSEKTNYLPPDRWQADGKHAFSQMTSITNIGLYLLSLEVACRFGYLSLTEYLSQSQKLIMTLKQMERFHGHFYNWYNLKTLKVMLPRYISTVDCGNLAASLMTAEHNYIRFQNVDFWSDNFWNTLEGVLILTSRAMEHDGRKHSHPEIKKHREEVYKLITALPNAGRDVRFFYDNLKNINLKLIECLSLYTKHSQTNNLRYWSAKSLDLVDNKLKEIELFYPWLDKKRGTDDSVFAKCERQKTLEGLNDEINSLLSEKTVSLRVKTILQKSQVAIQNTLRISSELANDCQDLYKEMDFLFLYNGRQKLFHIGYNDTTKKFDRNHYDLLASESRLTSFVTLALNQVPLEHWQTLSRPIAASGGKLALFSWGGSLFEYLFPQIFLNSIPGSLITKALEGAISDHINFAHKKGVPWGISESCYDQKNKKGDYQYAIHGVPFLSLRPILRPDLVVSPYSSFLALEFSPKETYRNLKRLEKEGAEGKYGFYEAIDYNKPTSLIFGGKVVRAFLAHHQSIILMTIYNYLKNGDLRNSFNQHPAVKPLNFILSEQATLPKTLRSAERITQEIRQFQHPTAVNDSMIKTNFHHLPLVNLISNAKYRIYLTDRGDGFSQFENINLNPWRADPTLGGNGNHLYIWDEKSKELISPTPSFTPPNSTKQTVEFTENEANFEQINKELATKLTIGLLYDEGLEYRSLTIKNLTAKSKKLKIAYISAQILANGFEDRIHPSFNRLKTKVRHDKDLLIYSRRRMLDETNIYTGLKALPLHDHLDFQVITSRRDFVGRLPGDLPLALSDNQKIYGSRGFDLIYGNVTRVRLLPFMESKIVYLSCASFSQQKVIGTMGKYQCFNDFAGSLQEDRDSDEYREEVDWAVVPKLLSLLFYRRPTNPSNIFSKNEEILGLPELKNRIGADSDNPILTSRVDSKTSKTAFRQLALYAQSLARKGFGLNFVVITVDEDGYFQSNFDFVEKLLLEDDTKEKPSEIFHNLIIIKESERSPKEIESLKILSTLYIDLGAGSFKDQVESEYKRL